MVLIRGNSIPWLTMASLWTRPCLPQKWLVHPILELLLNFSEKIRPSRGSNPGPSANQAAMLTTTLLKSVLGYLTFPHIWKPMAYIKWAQPRSQHPHTAGNPNTVYSLRFPPNWFRFFQRNSRVSYCGTRQCSRIGATNSYRLICLSRLSISVTDTFAVTSAINWGVN